MQIFFDWSRFILLWLLEWVEYYMLIGKKMSEDKIKIKKNTKKKKKYEVSMLTYWPLLHTYLFQIFNRS